MKPEDYDFRIWTCPRCGITNAHTTCPTLGCTGKRPVPLSAAVPESSEDPS